ncbi:beta-ketoacyl synthase N-terminal-like domain-containing protein [Plantactinospora solaniradicis]|uniref:Beta-ketoacyl synthase N-terminal-like domain-containing protein n=1 Tax=Plantactinospora solaniradicis TaxID=1723736 RepID=A0ABW1K5J2_9ACTN
MTGPQDLVRLVGGASAAPSGVRRFEAPYTDLDPVDRLAAGPVEPRMPPGVAVRGLRALPHESLLALAAAVTAEDAASPTDVPLPAVPPSAAPVFAAGIGPVAVLWASSSAGLAEYATICVEAAVLDPGLSSPIIGPASAFNGPAATVSIRLGLDGPNETLTGGTTAGLTAVIEAGRFVADGAAARALVGASATVSRWSLAGLAEDFVAAEGAGCLAVQPWHDGDPGVRLGRFHRVGLDRSRLVAEGRDLVRTALPTSGTGDAAPGTGAVAGEAAVGPGPMIVSALDVDLVEALAEEHPGPVWHLERSLGDFGAAGGFMAVACAVAYCASASAPTSMLALAIEPSGNAAIMEVFTWGAPTSSSVW